MEVEMDPPEHSDAWLDLDNPYFGAEELYESLAGMPDQHAAEDTPGPALGQEGTEPPAPAPSLAPPPVPPPAAHAATVNKRGIVRNQRFMGLSGARWDRQPAEPDPIRQMGRTQ